MENTLRIRTVADTQADYEMYLKKIRETARVNVVDLDKTSAIVEKAKGSRSMRQFAEEMGMNASSVSRIINKKVDTISFETMAKIIAHSAFDRSTTYKDLISAQGLVKLDVPNKLTTYEETCRRIMVDELLKRGYSASYPLYSGKSEQYHEDFAIQTDALTKGNGRWKITAESFSFNLGRDELHIVMNWLRDKMLYYYLGGEAGRITILIDQKDIFNRVKEYFSHYIIPDEISVILISVDRGCILEEYIIPLRDGSTPKTVFN